ncbi:hypothetical protein Pcinc_014161 [Petrolisthes cinctipes]|uniref:Regulatory protein zeste n=1 Tax=Petrolisthes cinctipes TaxID=88211 RepID=A0AAE1FVW5_PETCI|nr:hypothetical protein Pcinc_014161 [Petrolisthes cinctipes]
MDHATTESTPTWEGRARSPLSVQVFWEVLAEMPTPAKRVAPLSRQEKSYLLQIITEHNIIADKRTQGSCVVAKQRAWERSEHSFNSAGFGGPVRTVKQLLKIWDHLKQMAKKENTLYRRECKLTGGGKHPPDVTEDTKIIMDFIKDEFKHPESEFDSNNVRLAHIQQKSEGSPVCTIFVSEGDIIDANIIEDTTELPNLQEPHSRVAYNSTAVATFEDSTLQDYIPTPSVNGKSLGQQVMVPGENVMDTAIANAGALTGTMDRGFVNAGANVLSPIENLSRHDLPPRASAGKAVQEGLTSSENRPM